MPDQLQLRGGTTAQHASFTGASKEVTVDTTKKTAVVHDGATAGGNPLLREDGSNSALALGSAGTPSLKFTGDTNTGIYSPGADQVAISTNGTGRLFVDSSGNVGVGTASPTDTGGYGRALDIQSNTGAAIYLRTNDDTSQIAQGSSDLTIRTRQAHPIIFSTNNNEAARITSDGKLGLGTSSPSSLMHLQTTAANVVLQMLENNGSTVYGASLDAFNSSGGNVRIRLHDSGGTYQERFRITSTGNVGIGTSSPSALLHVLSGGGVVRNAVNDGTSAGTATYALNSSNGAYDMAQITATQGASFINPVFKIRVSDTSKNLQDRLTILSSGNVGIGTTSPAANLELGTVAAANQSLRINSAGNNYLELSTTGATGEHKITAGNSASGTAQLIFETASGGTESERARIDSSGRLLVGTSTSYSVGSAAAAIQQINFSSGSIGQSIVRHSTSSSSGPVLAFGRSKGSSVGSITAVAANDDLGEIRFAGADGTNLEAVAASVICECDGTVATGSIPARLVFSVTSDGSASPTARMAIKNNGDVHIGGSDTVNAPFIELNQNGTSQFQGKLTIATASAAGTQIFQAYGATGEARIFGDGDLENTNNSYAGLSDIKLKENIVDANSQWDDLKTLQVRNYNFKPETGYSTHTQIGLIAQEVELVSPGLVSESPDRDEDGNDLGTVTKSVNYSVLYMKAVKALQEAMERIEVLEQRLADAGIA